MPNLSFMISRLIYGGLILFLLVGCTKDSRVALFELFYPNNNFTIQAGLGGFFPIEKEWNQIQTNFTFFLNQSGVEEDLITGIRPVSARLTSNDPSLDFFFVEEVSVRICDVEEENCIDADEAFYIDRLQGRANDVIELLPTLVDFKDLIKGNRFKLELIFFLSANTPYNLPGRLDMTFEAVQ